MLDESRETRVEERGMEAVLRFPLPECQTEFEDAVNGSKWQGVMWDLLEQNLRRKVHKGEHEFQTPQDALDFVWETAWELMNDAGLDFHG